MKKIIYVNEKDYQKVKDYLLSSKIQNWNEGLFQFSMSTFVATLGIVVLAVIVYSLF